ncbi:MAG: hypothetical protein LBE67_08630 [Kocuria palustris]|nr:hypothetical protein [Kocuria palustris]
MCLLRARASDRRSRGSPTRSTARLPREAQQPASSPHDDDFRRTAPWLETTDGPSAAPRT